jgi:hypothetical protein
LRHGLDSLVGFQTGPVGSGNVGDAGLGAEAEAGRDTGLAAEVEVGCNKGLGADAEVGRGEGCEFFKRMGCSISCSFVISVSISGRGRSGQAGGAS